MPTVPVRLLAGLAARVLRHYQPFVVGITGSVGKTSARTATVSVLAAGGLRVRGSPKNYNNELGLPLSVIGATSAPGRSPVAWALVYLRALRLLLVHDSSYPTHLVLEYGADHPGDIGALVHIAPPKISVVTAVAPAHLEFFGSVSAVAAEKGTLIEALPPDGVAVLNADDPVASTLATGRSARVITYGFAPTAMVRAHDAHLALNSTHDPLGVRWHLTHGSDVAEFVTTDTLGHAAVSSALAGAAVGVALGINFQSITRALTEWHPPAGRMRLLAGIGGSVLLDDSYNSSPVAAHEAINTLAELRMSIPAPRRATVVLGTMAELGSEADRFHRELGVTVAAINPDRLVTVGKPAAAIADGAVEAGLPPDRIKRFDSAGDAARWLRSRVVSGDIVLVKGSQSARCERISAALLAHPEDAKRLLVRQGSDWQDRP
jgi:UDP-N-acetylmuramoyl-tripeptide--D-alanyl-D-alanine ligase